MQFRDLGAQYGALKTEIDAGIQSVIGESNFIFGKQVVQLEEELAAYVGVKHCVSCANGTDALQLVLMAWGIGSGDAVFTSDFTFFASAGTISIMGATPVLVDIDAQTFNIDPLALEKAIIKVLQEGTLKPKAIVPVDLFGQPADYDRICKIAEKYNLLVLEDGAQGFGGEFYGKKACSFGHAATTSFFPAKPLGCYGDGGAIFTNDSALDELLRSMRAQGRSPEDKYDNRLIGMNSRLDTLQAAILLPKLKAFASAEVERVNEAAGRYTKLLQDVVITPFVAEGARSSWAQYSILLKNKQQRDGLQAYLKQQGIPSMVYYPRGLHQQSAYAFRNLPDSDFPNTVDTAARILALPMHPYLSQEDITCVAAAVINYLAD